MQALKDLAAAYRGQSSLPEPHPARVGTVAQLVHAVEQIGGPVPAALLDPRLAQPVPEVGLLPVSTACTGALVRSRVYQVSSCMVWETGC